MPNRFLSSTKEYRFGYQGQYAEKDAETGLNHFEARDYDSRIGRWATTDPAGQYWSSYLGMGNNPVSGVDPDGNYSWFGAAWRMIAWGGHDMAKVNGEWGFNYGGYDLESGESSAIFQTKGDYVPSYKEYVNMWSTRQSLIHTINDCGYEANSTTDKIYFLGGQLQFALPTAKMATISKAAESGALYHYTTEAAANSISKTGLNLSRDGFVYSTTKGGLSPLQAQVELALSPNRGLPNALFKLDVQGLSKAGINPVLGPRLVTGGNFGAGGGFEVLFNQPIPAQYLLRLK